MTDIPKKPIAVSRAKKKLPLEIDWGKGIPKDRLRYINAREEALIKAHRHSKAERSHEGVKAYPDPGDTAAGQKGVGGVSTGNSSTGGGDKGGKGQGGQGSGPSRSPSSSSKSPSSTSKPAKTSTQSAAAPAGGSRAPNAAAQAASNKLNSGAQASRSPLNSAGGSSSLSRAPNAAAKAAFDKLNASKNALSTSSRPQSIQGMINSGTATAWGGADPRSKAAAAPGQGVTKDNMRPNAYTDLNAVVHREMQDLGQPNKFVDNSPRALNDFTINQISRFTGRTPDQVKQMAASTYGEYASSNPLQRAAISKTMENRLNYGNRYGGYGSGDIYKMLRAYDANGFDVANRDVPVGGNTPYRNALNGGAALSKGLMGGTDALDPYSDFHKTAPSSVQNATHYLTNAAYSEAAQRPTHWVNKDAFQGSMTQYGPHIYGNAEDTVQRIASLNGSLGSTGLAAAAKPSEPPAPGPQPIPSPISQGMLGSQPQQAPQQAQLPTDPRLNLPQGNLAPPEMGSPPGYMSQFAMTPQDMDSLKQQAMKDFSFGELMQMQKNMGSLPGFMGPITRDQERVSQMASQAPQSPLPASLPGLPPGFKPPGNFRSPPVSNPDTYSPQAGPGDIETPPQVYSDNPMQGPSNPMQEGENPQVQRDRQKTYASRGATIGGIIAGPLGTVVGGTLGWQMGKTPPSQRRAIASNPKALNANVQSINKLVEDRGGKQPGMQVTPQGLQAVLTNPQQVASNPQQYTTLEQMLAALAMGIDPSTGKPIS